MAHPRAVTSTGCAICPGGRCEHSWLLPQVPANYPFFPPEMSAAMAAADDQPAPEPPPPAPTGKRAQRLAEDRMRRPGENTAHERGEDR